jgi:hypothetical protein
MAGAAATRTRSRRAGSLAIVAAALASVAGCAGGRPSAPDDARRTLDAATPGDAQRALDAPPFDAALDEAGRAETEADGGLVAADGAAREPDAPPSSPTLPGWVAALDVGEWYRIPDSNVGDLRMPDHPDRDPANTLGGSGEVGKVRGYSGAALRTEGSWIIAHGGGHNMSWGNDVAAIRLSAEEPEWVVLHPPTRWSDIEGYAGEAYYRDGLPAIGHTAYRNQFIDRLDSFVRFGGGVSFLGSGGSNRIDRMDFETREWDPADSHGALPAGEVYGDLVCKSSLTEEVFVWAGGWLHRWSPETFEWDRYIDVPDGYGYASYVASAHDPSRDRILIAGGYWGAESQRYGVLDLAARTYEAITLTGPSAADIVDPYNGMIYEPRLDRFLYFRAIEDDERVYRIHPETWSVDVYPVTGTPPPPRAASVFSRFVHVPELGGVAYVADSAGDTGVYFLRTSPAGR